MSRPFIFRINAAELFTELLPLNIEQKAAFITQLSTDLLTLNGTFEYSKHVIGETLQLIEKRSISGKLGGRPKSKTKAKVKQGLSKAKAKPKQEEEREEENLIPYDEIISDLNLKGGFQFKTGMATKKHINARFAEGFKKEDFLHVHTVKIAEWESTEMAKYLRPETLYGNKFDAYLNQKIVVKAAFVLPRGVTPTPANHPLCTTEAWQ